MKNKSFINFLLSGSSVNQAMGEAAENIHLKAMGSYEDLKEQTVFEADTEINPDAKPEYDDSDSSYDEGFEAGYDAAMRDCGAEPVDDDEDESEESDDEEEDESKNESIVIDIIDANLTEADLDNWSPQKHAIVYKDGKHKAISLKSLDAHKASGWKERKSVRAFMKAKNESLSEANIRKTNRVRAQKIQRNKLVSNRVGYRLQNGKLIRMTAQELRKRSLASRRSRIKVKAKAAQSDRKRKISLKIGNRAGIYTMNKKMRQAGKDLVKLGDTAQGME